jgi:heat-inducible transcriptional repressor
MNERCARILRCLVEEYLRTNTPVASAALVERYDLELSPATVRSVFALLEEEGYLEQPHPSAGRVPTDAGWRAYLEVVGRNVSLTRAAIARLRTLRARRTNSPEQLIRLAAVTLAELSRSVGAAGRAPNHTFYSAGLANWLEEEREATREEVTEIVRVTEVLAEQAEEILHSFTEEEPQVFIGQENPFTETTHTGVVLAPMRTRTMRRHPFEGFVAIVGPRRMDYPRNMNLAAEVASFLSRRLSNVR